MATLLILATASATAQVSAGELDGATEQQQLFGESRLARIGVGNYGKGSPPCDVTQNLGRKVEIALGGAHQKTFGGRKRKAAGREDAS